MRLEEAIYRIKIHKECAGLENGTCIVNIKDLETLLKEQERLQEENRLQRGQLNSAFDNGFVHKDKIREKLEELQKQYEQALEENSIKSSVLKCQIEILIEFLEGK